MRAPLLVACLAAVPASLGAQTAAGRIAGVVYDSTRAGPLAGATVFLAGTQHSAVTGTNGRFQLSAVPAGTLQLFFVHPRLDALEYTPPSHTITLAANDSLDVHLAIAAAETIARAHCPADAQGQRLLDGLVATSTGGQPVAQAIVEIRWRGGSARDTTSDHGRFRFCALPTHERLTLQAERLGRVSAEQSIARDSDAYSQHTILLDFGADPAQMKSTLRASTGALAVMGQLRDAATGAVIANARVRLTGTPFQALSSSQGRFSFAHVPAGSYALEVEHIGYGRREQRFALPPGATVDLDVALQPAAISLEGITVRALTSEERERRAASSAGRIIGEAQLDEATRRGASVADVLRQHVTGLIIRDGTFEATDSNLPQVILCVESKRGPATVVQPTRRRVGLTFPPCDMIPVFVDDGRISSAGNFLRFTPLDIFVRIEYLPASAAAMRYGMHSENKGVLALYTKRPQQRK